MHKKLLLKNTIVKRLNSSDFYGIAVLFQELYFIQFLKSIQELYYREILTVLQYRQKSPWNFLEFSIESRN